MASNRVVLFENTAGASRGALQGVAGDDLLLAGGIKRASSTISIDSSGNVILTGASVIANSAVDMTSHAIHNVANPAAAQDAATKTYVDTSIGSGSVILSNGTIAFTGNESMGGNKLTNVGAPTTGGDATNKTYVDTQDTSVAATAAANEALDLRLDGSRTMTGALNMGTHLIDNVVNPVSAQDAATKNYTDTQEALDLRLDGSRIMTGALDMGTHLIHNVVDPIVAQDAATKNYVDTTSGGSGVVLAFAEVNYTGGTEGFTAIADVTGVTVTFNLTTPGAVQFFASGASLANPFIQGNYLGLAINVNGTDYYGNGTGAQGFNAVGGGNLVTSGFTSGDAITMFRVLNLSAGFYTVKLRAFGNGYLESSSNFPTRLVAVYPTIGGTVATASPITMQEAENVTGVATSNGTQTYVVIPNTLMSIVLPGTQVVDFTGIATIGLSGSYNAQLGIRIDGIDYNGTGTRTSTSSANDRNTVVVNKGIQLAAGSHTAQLVLRQAIAAAGNAETLNSVDLPTRLTAIYTVPEALTIPSAAFLTKQETGPFANTINPVGTEYAVASGSTITVSLIATQTILMSAYTHFIDPGSNSVSGNVGIRVTSPGPVTTDYDGSQSRGGNDVNYAGSSITRAIQLGAGVHTFELITRNPASGAQYEFANAFLTVVYTVPQAIPPSDFAFVEAVETGGQFDSLSASFVDVTGTTVNFSLTDTKNVIVKAEFVGMRDAADTDLFAYYALSIDGIDYNKGSLKLSLSPGFNGRWPIHIEKTINLAAGAHVVKLRLKSNGANNSHIASNTDEPTVVTVQYIV